MEDGLAAALDSVLAQRAAAQVVVVDNASTVAVGARAGVTVVRSDRRLSRGATRNFGLASVSAPLVVFLDADDVMLPESLSRLVAGIAARPHSPAYAMAILDGDTGRRHRSPRALARVLARRPALFALANATWSLLPTVGATIMRCADVRAAGGFADADRGEDWALGASLACRGAIGFDRRPALVYRWRRDSPGRDAGSDLLARAACVRERLRTDPGVPERVRRALPAVAVLQWTAIFVVRPVYRRGRDVFEAPRRDP